MQNYKLTKQYDVIVLYNSIMRLSKDEQILLLKEIISHLAPHGIIILSIATNFKFQPRNVISDKEIYNTLKLNPIYTEEYTHTVSKNKAKKFKLYVFKK